MAGFAKIEELDLAALGTQTASIFTRRFAKNARSNEPEMDSIRNSAADYCLETERYFEKRL